MTRFTAYCAQGHDRIDFTDGDVFVEHMRTEHGRRTPYVGQYYGARYGDHSEPTAAGWTRNGFKVHEWKAPRRTAGGIDRVAERIANGEYRWEAGRSRRGGEFYPEQVAGFVETEESVASPEAA